MKTKKKLTFILISSVVAFSAGGVATFAQESWETKGSPQLCYQSLDQNGLANAACMIVLPSCGRAFGGDDLMAGMCPSN